MKYFGLYIVLLNFFSFATSFAQKALVNSPQPTIDLRTHDQSQYIGKHISWFEDKEGSYTIQSISSSPNQLFTASNVNISSFGHSGSVFWLKIAVEGQNISNDWVLEISYPSLDSVSFYYRDSTGVWYEKNDGNNWPFNTGELKSRNLAFKLPQTQDGSATYYIKVKAIDVLLIPIKIEKRDFFISENLKREVFYGICYGIMIIMLFYNLFIYVATRDKNYIYYVLQVAFAILFYGFFYMHIPNYVTHFRSPFINYIMTIILCLWFSTIILFVKSFLNLHKVSSFLNRLLNVMLFLGVVALIILPFKPALTLLHNYFLANWAFLCAIISMISGIVSFRKGNREAYFFIFAWGFYLFLIIVNALYFLGAIPAYDILTDSLLIGSVLEITLLSFALADKISIYRKEKELAQAQIIALKQQEAAELEQKVKERTAELEEVNRDLEAFSHSVSHDLRSPLTAIIGFSEILEEDNKAILSDESKDDLKNIQTSARNMGNLIEDLLNFSHSGKKELIKEKIDMKVLIYEVIEELKLHQAPEREIDIKVGVIENTSGDKILIKQVWVNFISNAIKYSSKKAKTEIEIASHVSDKEITYWVKDNGAGFNMEHAQKLFGVFQRLHSKNEFEGTGIGLSIVQKVVTRHGGRVWAEAKEGEGATFYFSLPK